MDDRTEGIIKRFSAASVTSALRGTPAVMVNGRVNAENHMARELIHGERPYLTLNNQTTRLAAETDPTGMIRDLDRATIDEVQLAPDLLRAIKEPIDNDRRSVTPTSSSSLRGVPTHIEPLTDILVVAVEQCVPHW